MVSGVNYETSQMHTHQGCPILLLEDHCPSFFFSVPVLPTADVWISEAGSTARQSLLSLRPEICVDKHNRNLHLKR